MELDRKKDFNMFEDKELSKEEVMALQNILDGLYRERGVDFRQYRHKCLKRRIVLRMSELKLNSFFEYDSFLKKNIPEYEKLLNTIAINVSEFFRNPETFKAVREQIMPLIIEHKKRIGSQVLRVWSAGCATGEEPHSLAIMLKEIKLNNRLNWTMNIFATDIDEDALRKANKGCYGATALKNLTSIQIERYLIKNSEKEYAVKPEFKSMIKFMTHNMINDNPLERIDLIFCRNVSIYFNKGLQEKVFRNFYRSLTENGYLVCGKAEILIGVAEGLFDRINLRERIFKKI